MARKTLADIDPKLKSVLDEFHSVSFVKYEMAKDAYELQNKETRKVIDRIVATLQQYATGHITAKIGNTIVPIKIDNEYLGYNLLYLAVEIVKDLAFLDIRVAGFKFPPLLCASCGEPIPEKTTLKKAGKRG